MLLAGPMDDGCTPDQALYEKATAAVKEKRFDVACLTLHTLITTYPDSEYGGRAKLQLGDVKFESAQLTEGRFKNGVKGISVFL